MRPLLLPPLRLQVRDREILAAVFRHRYLSADQVRSLLFPGRSRQVVQLRLRALWAHRFLDRYYLPVVLSGSHPPPALVGRPLYTLARPGAQVIAEDQGGDGAAIPATPAANARGYATLEHHLVVIDFVVALLAACRERTDVTVSTIEYETRLRTLAARAASAAPRMEQPLIPDGAITLTYPERGTTATFYLEVLRAGVKGGNATLERRLRRYAAANHAGRFARWYGHPHLRAVLLVTTSPTRAEHFRTLAATLPHGRRLFWFGTYLVTDAAGRERTALTPETILSPRWRAVDGSLQSLIPPDAGASPAQRP